MSLSGQDKLLLPYGASYAALWHERKASRHTGWETLVKSPKAIPKKQKLGFINSLRKILDKFVL